MLKLTDGAPRKHLISMTPLIDVVFILLLFFMLSSTFKQTQQIDMQMAGATAKATLSDSVSHRMQLLADGRIRLADQTYSSGSTALLAKVADIASNQEVVYLAAVNTVAVQQLIAFIDWLSMQQVNNIKLAESVAAGTHDEAH